MADRLEALVTRLEACVARLEKGGKPVHEEAAEEDVKSPYELFLDEQIPPIMEAANKLGGEPLEYTKLLIAPLQAVAEFIKIASKCKKPAPEEVVALYRKVVVPLSQKVLALENNDRRGKYYNHGKLVAEIVRACDWVVLEPPLRPYVESCWNAAQGFRFKISKDFRQSEPAQVDWALKIENMCRALEATCIKENYATGVSWNNLKGVALKDYQPGAPKAAAPAAVPPPPPPPAACPPPAAGLPPPPPLPPPGSLPPPSAADNKPNMGALFSSLNVGGAITAGLTHVTKEMKAKPAAGAAPPAPAPAPAPAPSSAPRAAPAPAAAGKPAAPPMLMLECTRWRVENHKNNRELVVEVENTKQFVTIYNCQNCLVRINGKVNNVSVERCTRVQVLCESIISSFSMSSCQDCEAQITASIPSAIIDGCANIKLYLPPQDAVQTEIISTKCVGIVIVPLADEEQHELAIPQTVSTKLIGGKLVSTFVQAAE